MKSCKAWGHASFGMLMPKRSYSTAAGYRYGFNGKENDNEVKGLGNQQDYGMRIYDARAGRFLSVDPLTKDFPWNSPYTFAENDPVSAIDMDGLEKYYHYHFNNKTNQAELTHITVVNDNFYNPVRNHEYAEIEKDGITYKGNHSMLGRAMDVLRESHSVRFTDHDGSVRGAHFDELDNIGTSLDWALAHGQADMAQTQSLQAGLAMFYYVGASGFAPGQGSYRPTTITGTDRQATSANSANPNSLQSNAAQRITLKESWVPSRGTIMNYSLTGGRVNLANRSITNGKFDFVVTLEGNLVLGSKHYTLANGAKSVQAAGQLKIFKGKVVEITNNSGHYKPSLIETKKFAEILKKMGVDVSGARVKTIGANGQTIKNVKLK